MHPGFWAWWRRQAEAAAEGGWSGCAVGVPHPGFRSGRGCGSGEPAGQRWHMSQSLEEGGGFGVRRPLRFLAHKLELNDEQVTRLAAILSTLKTERAQSEVDARRRTASLAEAFEASSFDAAKVEAAAAQQLESAARLQSSVKVALSEMHALFDEAQRKKFAYLLRAGALSI